MKRNTFHLARSLGGVRRNHRVRYEQIVKLRRKLSEGQLTREERVDAAYLMREMRDVYNDIRKEFDATIELITKLVCAQWVKDSENINEQVSRSIRGELALGTPSIKFTANVPSPHKDPERYKALLDSMGIDPANHHLVRPHWPELSEFISAELAAGRPPPAGITMDKTYINYRLSLRKLANGDDEKGGS